MSYAYLQAWDRFRSVITPQDKRIRGTIMGDTVYIIGVILFFFICALYVTALDRI
jgi:hypothetical protein